jgi:hypothetical protein
MEEQKLEISRLKKNIKKKHRELTLGTLETSEMLERQLKPITEPLNKILLERNEEKKENEDFIPDVEMTDPFISKLKKRKREEGNEERSSKHRFNYGTRNTPMDEDILPDELDTLPLDDGRKSPLTASRTLSQEDTIEKMLQTSEGKRRAIIAMKTLSNEWLNEAGDLPEEYIRGYIEDSKKQYDYVYGIKIVGNDLKLGSAFVSFEENNIVLTKEKRGFDPLIEQLGLMKTVHGTRGLYELIFKTEPANYTEDDMSAYKEVLQFANPHRVMHSPSGQLKSNRGRKYKEIISYLFPPKGKGLEQELVEKVNYVYYNDPNELCERLKLLVSSQRAGHTGHTNEINSIIEELSEAGLILKSEPKI